MKKIAKLPREKFKFGKKRKKALNFFGKILENRRRKGSRSQSNLRIFYRLCEFLDLNSLENLALYLKRDCKQLRGWDFMLRVEKRKKMLMVRNKD